MFEIDKQASRPLPHPEGSFLYEWYKVCVERESVCVRLSEECVSVYGWERESVLVWVSVCVRGWERGGECVSVSVCVSYCVCFKIADNRFNLGFRLSDVN